MSNNASFWQSVLGFLFHGCWHYYTEWSDPFDDGYKKYQSKECLKCGRVSYRTVSSHPEYRRTGGAKPNKPDSLPTRTPSGKSGR